MGPILPRGGGKMYPEISENMNKLKNVKVNNQKEKKTLGGNVGRFSQKSKGSTALRLLVLSTNVITIACKS